jgi:hypothetical protein
VSVYYAVGKRLVPHDEWLTHAATRQTLGAEDAAEQAKLPDVTPPALRRLKRAPAVLGAAEEFQPTGLGKPLAIWITSAHAGELGGGSFWRGHRGVLVSSAIKSWVTPDAQPRALNIIKQRVDQNATIGLPSATEPGSPLVFYSPAAVDRRLLLTVELAFDNVDEGLFKGLGGIFDAAGGLPVFATAQPYLLAASALFKMGGAFANRLFDSRAEFSATENITLALQDGTGFAGYLVMTRTPAERKELQDGFSVSDEGTLVDKNGQPYNGGIPHVVVALDGRAEHSFEKFSAAAVSASLLQKFYNIREDGATDAKLLTDALTLYNDFRYNREAASLKSDLAAATGKSKEELQLRYDALVKNIKDEAFKPK